jgi:putative FmdB family regulatory protein
MPTYEYGCSACGNEWEEMQRITAAATEVCPKCGKPTAHRLISAGTNFILKGGGWYSDLYSSTNGGAKKTESKGESTSDSGTSTESKSATSEAKGDAKPAASPTPSTPPSSTPSSS